MQWEGLKGLYKVHSQMQDSTNILANAHLNPGCQACTVHNLFRNNRAFEMEANALSSFFWAAGRESHHHWQDKWSSDLLCLERLARPRHGLPHKKMAQCGLSEMQTTTRWEHHINPQQTATYDVPENLAIFIALDTQIPQILFHHCDDAGWSRNRHHSSLCRGAH